jgi:hypothetical protein
MQEEHLIPQIKRELQKKAGLGIPCSIWRKIKGPSVT